VRRPFVLTRDVSAHAPAKRAADVRRVSGAMISEVERLSGRRVIAFISNSHVGPDLEIEIFVLGSGL
jgi:hypothetical protein